MHITLSIYINNKKHNKFCFFSYNIFSQKKRKVSWENVTGSVGQGTSFLGNARMAQPQTQTDTDSMGAPHAEVAVIYFWHTKCPRCPLEKGQNGRYFGQIHPTLVSCESSQSGIGALLATDGNTEH